MRDRREWGDLFRSLGRAFFDLLGAEAEALGQDFGRSGRHLAIVTVTAVVMLSLLFWTLGIVTAGLVAVLAIWLPVWGASFLVALLFVLAIAGLGLYAWRHAKKLEGPARIVGRRWRDHATWWNTQVLGEPVSAVAPPAVAAGDDEEIWEDEDDDATR